MRSNSIWLKLLIVVLAPALLLAVARPANADTDLYVNGDCGMDTWTGMNARCVGPDGPKATIQAAIVAAIGYARRENPQTGTLLTRTRSACIVT
ncbi:MAG: hypothetical protein IH889_06865 [Planctomycetes bacterium]|nr:hypothetical protein [Planctomycetota bacterium]